MVSLSLEKLKRAAWRRAYLKAKVNREPIWTVWLLSVHEDF